MSRKKTKPPVKSEKGEAPIRSSPATRALRFLLGKDNNPVVEPALNLPGVDPVADLAPIDREIKIETENSSQRAGSIRDSSDSQLPNLINDNLPLPQSQLPQSQPHKSQLKESQLESATNKTDDLSAVASPAKTRPATSIMLNWRAIEHTRIPQVVFDEILPQLPAMAQVPYLQLLRLTLGFQRSNCHISLESWAARCNQSLASIKRQAVILQQRGLLKKDNVIFGGMARGSYYRPVIPGILNDEANRDTSSHAHRQLPQSQLWESQPDQRRLRDDHMKRDHEDHEKEKDHHESSVMKIYQELTGNRITNADIVAFRKIDFLDNETIIAHMRLIYERSIEPIGSFAYFTKAVLKATQEHQQTRAAHKRNLEKIIGRIRANRAGARATLADLIEDIKRACARDNVIYNNDLVNEILGL